jgi:hypothetical protein
MGKGLALGLLREADDGDDLMITSHYLIVYHRRINCAGTLLISQRIFKKEPQFLLNRCTSTNLNSLRAYITCVSTNILKCMESNEQVQICDCITC